MIRSSRAALFATSLLAPVTAGAAEATLQIELGSAGDFQRQVVRYDCAGGEQFDVTYINAAPNFLALVPVAGESEPLIFVAVMAASGVRYAAGHWLWWTQQSDASLYDVTLGEDAEPVLTCAEINNTP